MNDYRVALLVLHMHTTLYLLEQTEELEEEDGERGKEAKEIDSLPYPFQRRSQRAFLFCRIDNLKLFFVLRNLIFFVELYIRLDNSFLHWDFFIAEELRLPYRELDKRQHHRNDEHAEQSRTIEAMERLTTEQQGKAPVKDRQQQSRFYNIG